MNDAKAIGFWAKNPLIMDALDALEDLEQCPDSAGLPQELVDLVGSHRGIIDSLIAEAHSEIVPFDALYKELRTRLDKAGAKLRTREQATNRDHNVYVTTSDGRKTKCVPLEFGWNWHTEWTKTSPPKDALYINTWIWAKGGRASEKLLFEQLEKLKLPVLAKIKRAESITEERWHPGSVRLDRVCVSERVGSDFSLDMDALVADVRKSFHWITELRLSKLFNLRGT